MFHFIIIQRTLQVHSNAPLYCIWLQKQLEIAGPVPIEHIPGCSVENVTTGSPILKYKKLLDLATSFLKPLNLQVSSVKGPSCSPVLVLLDAPGEGARYFHLAAVFSKRAADTEWVTAGATKIKNLYFKFSIMLSSYTECHSHYLSVAPINNNSNNAKVKLQQINRPAFSLGE